MANPKYVCEADVQAHIAIREGIYKTSIYREKTGNAIPLSMEELENYFDMLEEMNSCVPW